MINKTGTLFISGYRDYIPLRDVLYHWVDYVSFPALLWIGLWFGINTGPWNLKTMPVTFIGWLHFIRTIFPLVSPLLMALLLTHGQNKTSWIWPVPVKLWLFYGLVSLAACMMSPEPFDAAYWCATYLVTFLALKAYLHHHPLGHLKAAIQLNYLSWITNTVFLVILLLIAREGLFSLQLYPFVGRIESFADMPMSRSSGMARFAAVPGIVSFVFFWNKRGWKQLLWLVVAVLSSVFIILLQSRGVVCGYIFALSFVMLFLGSRTRLAAAVVVLLLAIILFAYGVPEGPVNYLTQDHTPRDWVTLTNRTSSWKEAWSYFWQSPIWGWGGQADRYLMDWACVHNTYLYALLQSGVVGATAFVGGLLWAWVLFFRALKSDVPKALGQREFLVQAGGILAFFTVRSIPEICGALFGIDFMVMLPILAYLGILGRHIPAVRRTQFVSVQVLKKNPSAPFISKRIGRWL